MKLTTSLAVFWLAAASVAARPNVLFIAIDDMNDWTTVFDKSNPIQTPNLERLAARGMFFENAYCAAPACCPSRAAIMTGRAPHQSGVYRNGDAWAKLLPDAEVIPRYFMAHGYDTRGCGKIHHHGGTGRDPQDKPSFQKQGKWHLHAGRPEKNYNGYTKRPLSSPAFDWGEHNVDKHNDEYTVEWGVDVMQQEWKRDMKPQFLALGIFRPHLPFWAPARSFKPYPTDDRLVMPNAPKGDLDDVSPVGYRMTLKEKFFQENVGDQPDFSPGSNEQLVRCYQAASTFADEMVGGILDALDTSGQADNTIIVLWSDHGYHLGDKECYVKFTLWEKANRVPFIIVAPGVTTPGKRCKAPVSLLDIYPTLVDLAGLPPNPTNDGVSLKPLLQDPDAEWERPALMTYGKGNHAIRTRGYRYIRYEDGSEELYADRDGWNITNLVAKPELDSVLSRHRELLAAAVGPETVKRPAPAVSAVPVSKAPEAPVGELLFPNSDFETGALENWTAKGDAFTVQPTKGDNPTARRRRDGAAQQGDYWIGTFEKYDGRTGKPGDRRGDGPTGTLTSIPFTVEKRSITFRVGGGPDASKVSVSLLCDGKTTVMSAGFASETMKPVSFDASEFVGKNVQIVIADQATGGWGHINADDFRSSDKVATAVAATARTGARPAPVADEPVNHDNFDTYLDIGYDQALRPQFHFTSRKNWLNDPNGMVYSDGEWHMYFQHVAIANNTGPKSWGSAVSTDLMRWQQLPHAITPYPSVKPDESDRLHTIWSGSAVVDVDNALGKQKGNVKTLYAIYTATHRSNDGKSGFFQAAAYSTDRGRTWAKLNGGGPMIDHQVGYSLGQRDPRIFYYAPGKYYVVIMMIGGPERAVRLWKSTDLMSWEIIGDIPNKAAECIDMYHVALDGEPSNRKWVIADAGTHYEVGDFDGRNWKGSGEVDDRGRAVKHRFDYGDAYYAAQAFSQAPDGRVVHIGWLRSKAAGYRPFLEADMPFTQQMSVPAEITLRTTPDGIRMFRNPVKEIEKLYTETTRLGPGKASEINPKLASLSPELVDLTLTIAPQNNVSLNVRGLKIDYLADAKVVRFVNSQRVNGIKAAAMKSEKKKHYNPKDTGARNIPADMLTDGNVRIRALLDRASLEIFVNDGIAAGSFVVVPDAANRSIAIEAGDDLRVDSLVVNELKSIWPDR